MPNDVIKKIKQQMLEQLKVERANTEAKKATISSQKYAEKKANVDVEIAKLDEMLDLTIKQEQAKLNEKIALLRQEVADKKSNYDVVAKAQADAEAEAEVAHALRDFDEEISKLEKELA